jgi:hypothetical protein
MFSDLGMGKWVMVLGVATVAAGIWITLALSANQHWRLRVHACRRRFHLLYLCYVNPV